MSESYVIIHRTSDPIQADMLGTILRENGIAARVLGTRHGAAIGVGQHILQLHIEVPQSQAGTATDFIEAYFEQDGEALLAAEFGDDDDDDDDEPDPSRSRDDDSSPETGSDPVLAGLATLFVVGGSHLYTRRVGTALLLAAGQLVVLASLVSAQTAVAVHSGVMFAVLLGCDFIGGQFAARARQRGQRVSWPRQVALGALFVAAAGLVGGLFATSTKSPSRSGPGLSRPAAVQPAY